jgi:hypothetical protein
MISIGFVKKRPASGQASHCLRRWASHKPTP